MFFISLSLSLEAFNYEAIDNPVEEDAFACKNFPVYCGRTSGYLKSLGYYRGLIYSSSFFGFSAGVGSVKLCCIKELLLAIISSSVSCVLCIPTLSCLAGHGCEYCGKYLEIENFKEYSEPVSDCLGIDACLNSYGNKLAKACEPACQDIERCCNSDESSDSASS